MSPPNLQSTTVCSLELLEPMPLVPPGSMAVCRAGQLSCQSCGHLTNLPAPDHLKGNKGSFPLPPSEIKWHGRGTGAHVRAIYTWHLLTKCAHWPLDNAHSLAFSGFFFFPGENWLIYQNSLERHSAGIFSRFSEYSCEKHTEITSFSLSVLLFISMLSVRPALTWEIVLGLNYRFVLIALTRISHRLVGFSWMGMFTYCVEFTLKNIPSQS